MPKTAARASHSAPAATDVRTGEAAHAAAPRSGRAVFRNALIPALAVLLATLCVASAGIGAVAVPFEEVAGSLFGGTGPHDAVLWQIRFPRVALSVLIGASLGVAGAAMQGVFGNPLAEPGVIGVSSGAAVGAVGTIVLGFSAFGEWSVTVAAFLGGLIATFVVYLLSRSNGRTEVVTLVLTGIAVNAVAGAVVGLLTFLADDAQLRSISFWSLGSLGGATWPVVAGVLPFAVAGLVLVPLFARALDVLALGERSARHLGVDTERIRLGVILLAALLTGAAVAAAGIIGFVGLVVPHLVRLVAGPGHRVLLPASALAGAIVLLAADLVARTVAVPAELPIGVLTALLGGPFFLWLLRRTRAGQGGWA
ncbi:FecCD family ABC transporter permease [Streptosporangium carneum]|uniref:ABC transporter permease n=1 Tax=Streptosporangium carneum TaxID=47481 RepID=A0A9W6HZK3_9ACTN|nr:iron ABC transporter permease [Streptosporangium carneum]GLK08269.1 ABC transporter permease [Streptosporangium carneum]